MSSVRPDRAPRALSPLLALTVCLAAAVPGGALDAQQVPAPAGQDSVRTRREALPQVRVTAVTPTTRRRPLPDVDGAALYTTKKSERITVAATDANTALNNTRQLFSRAPGMMLWEQDPAGVQAGLAARGLSPNRSWEFNTRANGVDISSDVIGYPEAYYTPPFRSLERVDIVRGAAALQYGPQYGGLVNYVTKKGPSDRALAVEASQQGGAYGLWSGYLGAGGTTGRVTWYAYGETRRGEGWRRNADFETEAAGANVQVRTSSRGTLGVTLTYLDYALRQPGGLTEAQFAADARQSARPRDWFGAPWLVPALTYEHRIADHTTLDVRAFGLVGARNSVGLTTAPTVADTGINPRRVDFDRYRNYGAEARLLHRAMVGGREQVLVTGVRGFRGNTDRVRGRGTAGDAFSLALTADPLIDLDLQSTNWAAFVETQLALTDRITITPGVRLERIDARGTGSFIRATGAFVPVAGAARTAVNEASSETIALGGVGARVFLGGHAELYGNVSRAFRPATFAEQFQNDLVAVDPALRSSRGVSSDLGIRGAAGSWLSYDVSAFHIAYGDRIGTLGRAALGADSVRYPNGLRRNIGASRHLGVEAFAEADLFRLVGGTSRTRALSVFSSLGWTQAEYVRGPQDGKRVEYAPRWVARGGVSTRLHERLSGTLQLSHVSGVFSDAGNTQRQADGLQGWIPGYVVWDMTAAVRVVRGAWLDVSVNNLLDRRYFTRRATGYPGPGIIPADGRMITAGLRLDWTTLAR